VGGAVSTQGPTAAAVPAAPAHRRVLAQHGTDSLSSVTWAGATVTQSAAAASPMAASVPVWP
jgi:hypothetical protein